MQQFLIMKTSKEHSMQQEKRFRQRVSFRVLKIVSSLSSKVPLASLFKTKRSPSSFGPAAGCASADVGASVEDGFDHPTGPEE